MGNTNESTANHKLSSLLAKTFPHEDSEVLDTIAGILLKEIDPSEVEATRGWINRCFNRPCAEEVEMHALNALLDCHGVEQQEITEVRLYDGDDANGEPIEARAEIDLCFTYLNTGEMYAPTFILYDDNLYAADCGTFIETIEQQVQTHYNAGHDIEDFNVATNQLPGRAIAQLLNDFEQNTIEDTPVQASLSQNNMSM